ncbi:MAG: PEGA domain-containing protein [Armatimonadetes bacterium]|nr:PEGA domain-containing protein [Armatimonadota bacterium]
MSAPKGKSIRLPLFEQRLPLRFLARRVLQAMAERSVANFILGERRAPGRFVVARLVADGVERDECLQMFAESRAAIEREVARDAAARGLRPRREVSVELTAFTRAELESGAVRTWLAAHADGETPEELLARLRERGEIILAARTHPLEIETEPPGAAIYVDGRPLTEITPCRLTDVTAGEHRIALALPGYGQHEEKVVVPGDGSAPVRYRAILQPEPEMVLVEVRTFPDRARVTVGGEMRESPTRFRLPVGRHRLVAERHGYAPASVEFDVPEPEGQPPQIYLRLDYAGADCGEVVGRLVIHQPGAPAHRASTPPEGNPIAEFFRDPEREPLAPAEGSDVLGERPLYRGVLVIGRPDPSVMIVPDVRLFDASNTVSRGCHAWLEIYTDPGTGAEYNTFVIHNESPAGVLVDGQLVTASRALGDDSELQIGVFRMRVVKETPPPRVEF